jgi:hypothetical protein
MQSTTCHYHHAIVFHEGEVKDYNGVSKDIECWRLGANFNFISFGAQMPQRQQHNGSDSHISNRALLFGNDTLPS